MEGATSKTTAASKVKKGGHKSGISGIIAIIEHGLQQFVLHLDPLKMESLAFPLNRLDRINARNMVQPESLKLLDLGNRTAFGIFQDNRIFQVKSLSVEKEGDLQMNSVSYTDFGKLYPVLAAPVRRPGQSPRVVTDIKPLNHTDSVLITLSSKRYLIYNYLLGEVQKEIQPLRGSSFRVCPDFNFNFETQPELILYNATTIRKVDIQTFEIKQNIDLTAMTGTEGSTSSGLPSLQMQAQAFKKVATAQ